MTDDARKQALQSAETSAEKVEWGDPRVQKVYELLCDTESEPPEGHHWEGFQAQRIVAALSADASVAEPVALTDEQWLSEICKYGGWGPRAPDCTRLDHSIVDNADLLAIRDAVMHVSRPPAPEDGKDAARDHIRALIGRHADLLEQSEYTYFELAYTRQTGWMAWITDKPLACTVVNPERKILATGQGDTPDEACRAALSQGGRA